MSQFVTDNSKEFALSVEDKIAESIPISIRS
ncbi:hypothetical protein swp_3888 [Shewanella piezotolerans WP3]|uniref:Uncharacterized protein n=1 Tax=Shewanella piezotolerans (strain WP3 / JCM 13877) TaxID=225849 RepID=B8CQU9_SHEPW|nr:hypothetical protein swp_3888 [Shewanella piezotolerans WP3]